MKWINFTEFLFVYFPFSESKISKFREIDFTSFLPGQFFKFSGRQMKWINFTEFLFVYFPFFLRVKSKNSVKLFSRVFCLDFFYIFWSNEKWINFTEFLFVYFPAFSEGKILIFMENVEIFFSWNWFFWFHEFLKFSGPLCPCEAVCLHFW